MGNGGGGWAATRRGTRPQRRAIDGDGAHPEERVLVLLRVGDAVLAHKPLQETHELVEHLARRVGVARRAPAIRLDKDAALRPTQQGRRSLRRHERRGVQAEELLRPQHAPDALPQEPVDREHADVASGEAFRHLLVELPDRGPRVKGRRSEHLRHRGLLAVALWHTQALWGTRFRFSSLLEGVPLGSYL